ncbi:hypothetical protein GW17_00036992 [Ensete ventricosum]|nr:hypothetical protein GW17_00036992 [Ensete ventricosum]
MARRPRSGTSTSPPRVEVEVGLPNLCASNEGKGQASRTLCLGQRRGWSFPTSTLRVKVGIGLLNSHALGKDGGLGFSTTMNWAEVGVGPLNLQAMTQAEVGVGLPDHYILMKAGVKSPDLYVGIFCIAPPTIIGFFSLVREIVYPYILDPDGEDEGNQTSSSQAVSTRWISTTNLLQSNLATITERGRKIRGEAKAAVYQP